MATFDDRLSAFESSIPRADAQAAKEAKPKSVDERLAAFEASIPPEQSFGDKAKDVGISGLKGAIGLVDTGIGIADIPTGGRVGKALENEDGLIGLRTKQANDYLDSGYSERYKWQQKKFHDADGIIDKVKAAAAEPAIVGHTLIESAPSMIAGGALAKGLGAAGVLVNNPIARGAIGEGSVMAGAQEEQIRHQTPDGLTTPEQSALALGTGIMGGLVGYAGGKLTQGADVDTILARTASEAADAAARTGRLGIVKGVGVPTLGEAGEELVQSTGEQALQNIALDQPIEQGMADAAVLGTLAGGAMGAGAGAFNMSATNSALRNQQPPAESTPTEQQPTPSDPTNVSNSPPLETQAAPELSLAPVDAPLQIEQESVQAAPVVDQVAPQPPTVVVQTPEGNPVTLTEGSGSLTDAAIAAARSGAIPQVSNESVEQNATNADLALQPIAPTLTAAADQAVATTQDPILTTQDQSQVVNTPTQPAYTADNFATTWNSMSRTSRERTALDALAGTENAEQRAKTIGAIDSNVLNSEDRDALIGVLNRGIELPDTAIGQEWDAMTVAQRQDVLVQSKQGRTAKSAVVKMLTPKSWGEIAATQKDELIPTIQSLMQQAAPEVQPEITAQQTNYQSAIETVNPNSSTDVPVTRAKITPVKQGDFHILYGKQAEDVAAALGQSLPAGEPQFSYPASEHAAYAKSLAEKGIELSTPLVTKQPSKGRVASDVGTSNIASLGGINEKTLRDILGDKSFNEGAAAISRTDGTSDLGQMAQWMRDDGFDVRDGDHLVQLIRDAYGTAKKPFYSVTRTEQDMQAKAIKAEREGYMHELDAAGIQYKPSATVDELYAQVQGIAQADIESASSMFSEDDAYAAWHETESLRDVITTDNIQGYDELMSSTQEEYTNEPNPAQATQGDTQQVPEGQATSATQGSGQEATGDFFGRNETAQAIADAQRAKDAARNNGAPTEPLTLTGSDSLTDEGIAAGQPDLLGTNIQQENSSKNSSPISFVMEGDFWNYYGEQAKEIANALGIAIVTRNGKLAVGIPDHVKDEYAKQLLKSGINAEFKKAQAEQNETTQPKARKPREVRAKITQATNLADVFDRLTKDTSKAVKGKTERQVAARTDNETIMNIHDNFNTIVDELKTANKLTVDC